MNPVYILEAILLSKQVIRDNQIRIILFTEEFGKITAWAKKSLLGTDIGSIIEILIERKKQENIIHKIHPLILPWNEGWNYHATIEYLTLFQLIKEGLPEGMEQKALFDDTKEMLLHLSRKEKNEEIDNVQLIQLFILMKARFMKKQGFLKEEFFTEEEVLPVIYSRLDIASMKSMIHSKTISSSHLNHIEKAVQEGIYTIKNRI